MIAYVCLITNAKADIETEYKKKCSAVENIGPPPEDFADQKLVALTDCDVDDLYYGFTAAPDYVKARYCAGAENRVDILTMLYANGYGVKKNLDIAMHYACAFEGAPAELDLRLKHLERLKTLKENEPFNICDDLTSGAMMGYCASLASRREDVKKQKVVDSFISTLTPQEKLAFEKLYDAFKTYQEKRTRGEVDISGTARAAMIIGEEEDLKDRFIKRVNDSQKCQIPMASEADFKEADTKLNELYKELQKLSPDFFYSDTSGITPDSIKKTQRAWIKYRDSWVGFGRLKCSQISEDSWKALITNERIGELKDLLGVD
jgi:uncharacterized protein YecT (DUF1311 family)